jgi:hypothetical protein
MLFLWAIGVEGVTEFGDDAIEKLKTKWFSLRIGKFLNIK